MKFNSNFDFDSVAREKTLAIVAPGNLGDMVNFSNTYKKKGIDYIFDPGQSLPAWTKELLTELIQEKTSMTDDEILEKTETLIVTKGEFGSVVMRKENKKTKTFEIPVAKVNQVSDPTGAGDAYRAGLIKGLATSKNDIVHAAKIGAVCAAYCVEVYGPQNFHFTHEAFNNRFESIFGKKAF